MRKCRSISLKIWELSTQLPLLIFLFFFFRLGKSLIVVWFSARVYFLFHFFRFLSRKAKKKKYYHLQLLGGWASQLWHKKMFLVRTKSAGRATKFQWTWKGWSKSLPARCSHNCLPFQPKNVQFLRIRIRNEKHHITHKNTRQILVMS